MSEICIGIGTKESQFEDMLRLPEVYRYGWKLAFPPWGYIVCNDRSYLELEVIGYEKPENKENLRVNKPVTIRLFRKEGRLLIWQGLVNNLHLDSMPELKWMEKSTV